MDYILELGISYLSPSRILETFLLIDPVMILLYCQTSSTQPHTAELS